MYAVWHNILWSSYKGRVFSELQKLAEDKGIQITFYQIATTDHYRVELSDVDASVHDYPYTLLFDNAYEKIPKHKLYSRVVKETMSSTAKFVILAGYHAPEYWIQLACLALKGVKRGVFCDLTIHDRKQKFLNKLLKIIFFSFCDKFFCYGERSKEYLMAHGVPADRVVAGCQAAALPRDYDQNTILSERANRASLTPRVLYVGRLAPEKNLQRLIDAFVELRKSNPDATLRVVGSGPLKQKLIDYCNSINARGIEWIGSLVGEQLMFEYLAATMLILPSLSEPWGLVVNEALAYGCPVIVSNVCGCAPELVTSGVTGYLLDPLSVTDMTSKMDLSIRSLAGPNVSRACVNRISNFTSADAARQIFGGLVNY